MPIKDDLLAQARSHSWYHVMELADGQLTFAEHADSTVDCACKPRERLPLASELHERQMHGELQTEPILSPPTPAGQTGPFAAAPASDAIRPCGSAGRADQCAAPSGLDARGTMNPTQTPTRSSG